MGADRYLLLDSGQGKKLERFGPYVIQRPALQAIWQPQLPKGAWKTATTLFQRGDRWSKKLKDWSVEIVSIRFKLSLTEFGHLGVFPEQAPLWDWIQHRSHKKKNILNLFAYSGGATLAAALSGACVTHLDASKGMVEWAQKNGAMNGLKQAPIRWIVDDVFKFLKREVRRGVQYDGIILDPPTFGRGPRGEVFKIESAILPLLDLCRQLLTKEPLYFILSSHTPGFSPKVLHHLVDQTMTGIGGDIECAEMVLKGEGGTYPLPSGAYARWSLCLK